MIAANFTVAIFSDPLSAPDQRRELQATENVVDFLVSYLNDEYNEGGLKLADLWAGIGKVCEWASTRGTVWYEVGGEYLSIDPNMADNWPTVEIALGEWLMAECLAAHADNDGGASGADVMLMLDGLRGCCANLYRPFSVTHILIEPAYHGEPATGFRQYGRGSDFSINVNNHLQFNCTLGRVTIHQ